MKNKIDISFDSRIDLLKNKSLNKDCNMTFIQRKILLLVKQIGFSGGQGKSLRVIGILILVVSVYKKGIIVRKLNGKKLKVKLYGMWNIYKANLN